MRTCAGCRRRKPQHELLRFVAPGLALQVDPLRGCGGRGVYTCPRPECVSRASQRGGFSRGFRSSLRVDDRALLDDVRGVLSGSIAALRAQLDADGREDTETLRGLLAWRAAFDQR
ncbi:MAG: hypothetical protein CSA65_03830 [Proteobacteria bacterium]|nr:MAG: hypothetical protein CSB49_07705 [Pseudomonadota bacterium]PIE18888.1 MAG: hypothetical protein CSA65_03830 [Pseudomonadota bacterium]